MWFCHQCNAEMRPLMVPEPVCASCHGDFVEKIEDPADDPREFHHGDPADAAGLDPFLMLMQGIMNRGIPSERGSPRPNRSPTGGGNASSSFSFQIRSGSNGPAVFTIGGPNTLGGSPGLSSRSSSMSDFLHSGDDDDRPGIAGPLMAQYLMALLGNRGSHTELPGGLGDAVERGRMGDYVFNQEALDQIISNLMENSNASRPVPATDEIMDKLPREILEVGSSTLERDCAVCKEQFQLETEDPDEQIVITLPCGHPFHSACILPWLKSSGTCPVCRHQLITQPEHHPLPPRGSSPPGNGASRGPGAGGDGNLFHSLFGSMMGGGSSSTSSSTLGSGSSQSPTGRGGREHEHLPGGWDEELD